MMKARLPAHIDSSICHKDVGHPHQGIRSHRPSWKTLPLTLALAFIPERDLGNEVFRSNQVVQLKTVKLLRRCTAIGPRSVVGKITNLACISADATPSIRPPDEVHMFLQVKRKLGHYKAKISH